jgi:hypothetical protein
MQYVNGQQEKRFSHIFRAISRTNLNQQHQRGTPVPNGGKKHAPYRTIDVNALSDRERHSLADELYEIYRNIFRGWSQDKMHQLINDRNCILFKARIFLDEAGRSIGFAWINARYVLYKGTRYTVFFTAAGLQSTTRKQGLITTFYTKEIVKYRFKHPFDRIFCFQRLIHPASYCAWVNALHEMYPLPDRSTPPQVKELTSHLSELFQFKTVRKEDPFVVYTDNYVILDLDGDTPVVVDSKKPEARFYDALTQSSGDLSLLMIFPLNFKNVALAVSKNVNKRIRRMLNAQSN